MSEPTASELLEGITKRHPRETWHEHPACGIAEAALAKVSMAVAALEAIRDRHREGDFYYSTDSQRQCLACNGYWPCRNHQDAVRGLAALTPNTPTKDQA